MRLSNLIILSLTVLSSLTKAFESSENYILIRQGLTSNSANNFCASNFGTELATIRSASENAELENLCFSAPPTGQAHARVCLIGLTDKQNEGQFKWRDGSALTIDNFANDEPNDAGGEEDCGELGDFGLWNDVPCHRAQSQDFFVCNKPSLTGQCPCYSANDIKDEVCSTVCCDGQIVTTKNSAGVITELTISSEGDTKTCSKVVDGVTQISEIINPEAYDDCEEILADAENLADCEIDNEDTAMSVFFNQIKSVVNGDTGKAHQMLYIVFLFMVVLVVLTGVYFGVKSCKDRRNLANMGRRKGYDYLSGNVTATSTQVSQDEDKI